MMKSLLSEHDIQNLIISYLTVKGYYVLRMNSGYIPSMYKGKKRMIHLMPAGTPDLMAYKQVSRKDTCVNCQLGTICTGTVLFFIEVKKPGNKPTPLQIHAMAELERYGAKCFVATSIEDVEQHLS